MCLICTVPATLNGDVITRAQFEALQHAMKQLEVRPSLTVFTSFSRTICCCVSEFIVYLFGLWCLLASSALTLLVRLQKTIRPTCRNTALFAYKVLIFVLTKINVENGCLFHLLSALVSSQLNALLATLCRDCRPPSSC